MSRQFVWDQRDWKHEPQGAGCLKGCGCVVLLTIFFGIMVSTTAWAFFH